MRPVIAQSNMGSYLSVPSLKNRNARTAILYTIFLFILWTRENEMDPENHQGKDEINENIMENEGRKKQKMNDLMLCSSRGRIVYNVFFVTS